MTSAALSWPHLMAGDWATWFGSIGIVATLGVAVSQFGLDQRFRHREAVRNRAEKVAAWYAGEGDDLSGEPQTVLSIVNGSSAPIYEVVCTLVFVQGAAPHTGEEWVSNAAARAAYGAANDDDALDDLQQLPFGRVFVAVGPGHWKTTVDGGWGANSARPGAEIGFTDARGGHWIRRANGQLEGLKMSAIDHYGLDRPIDYQVAVADE